VLRADFHQRKPDGGVRERAQESIAVPDPTNEGRAEVVGLHLWGGSNSLKKRGVYWGAKRIPIKWTLRGSCQPGKSLPGAMCVWSRSWSEDFESCREEEGDSKREALRVRQPLGSIRINK